MMSFVKSLLPEARPDPREAESSAAVEAVRQSVAVNRQCADEVSEQVRRLTRSIEREAGHGSRA